MAVYKKEVGVCYGRGFETNGLLAKFKAWIEKAPINEGPGWYIIDDQSDLGTNPYIVVSDTDPAILTVNAYNISPSDQAPKIIKFGYETSQSSLIRVYNYMWWDSSEQKGYGQWTGYYLGTVDAGEFAYDFRGGSECLIITTRIGTAYYQYINDNFNGILSQLEDETHTAVIKSGITSGTNVVVPLNDWDENKFNPDNFYYIYDFNGNSWVDYVKVTNIDPIAHTITISRSTYDFPAGSVIGSYPHRYYACGSHIGWYIQYLCNYHSVIPYYSSRDAANYVFQNQASSTGIWGHFLPVAFGSVLARLNPDENGLYAIMKPALQEGGRANDSNSNTAVTSMNRMYGTVKNIIMARNNSYMRGVATKTVQGKTYLFYMLGNELFASGDSATAIYILDTESNS